jgi:peptidoglycan-associated lipoprotein
MIRPSLVHLAVSALAFSIVGCAHQKSPPPNAPDIATTTTSVNSASTKSAGNIGVSQDLATACKLDFNNTDEAPKFGFDEASLAPSDASVLSQIATCVTTGPMKGRALELVGRADPRGETEYNFVLGEHRAGSVEGYLAQLGVSRGKMHESSRGKLDATGADETGWQRDRRVDILVR